MKFFENATMNLECYQKDALFLQETVYKEYFENIRRTFYIYLLILLTLLILMFFFSSVVSMTTAYSVICFISIE